MLVNNFFILLKYFSCFCFVCISYEVTLEYYAKSAPAVFCYGVLALTVGLQTTHDTVAEVKVL